MRKLKFRRETVATKPAEVKVVDVVEEPSNLAKLKRTVLDQLDYLVRMSAATDWTAEETLTWLEDCFIVLQTIAEKDPSDQEVFTRFHWLVGVIVGKYYDKPEIRTRKLYADAYAVLEKSYAKV